MFWKPKNYSFTSRHNQHPTIPLPPQKGRGIEKGRSLYYLLGGGGEAGKCLSNLHSLFSLANSSIQNMLSSVHYALGLSEVLSDNV